MLRHIFLIALSCAVPAADPPIHPLALRQITCWESDLEEPVVTQFSLDAVEKNGNQFYRDEVSVEGEWVRWRHGRESCNYHKTEVEPGLLRFEVFTNGGGTLTLKTVIDGRIMTRDLVVNGKPVRIRVFDVVAVNPLGPFVPH